MKTLTKSEQLKKEASETWKSFQILDSRAGKLRNKIFEYENRIFHRESKLRMMRYERDELEKIASQLASYTHMLNDFAKQEEPISAT